MRCIHNAEGGCWSCRNYRLKAKIINLRVAGEIDAPITVKPLEWYEDKPISESRKVG